MEKAIVAIVTLVIAFVGLVQAYQNSISEGNIKEDDLRERIYKEKEKYLELKEKYSDLKAKNNRLLLEHKRLLRRNKILFNRYLELKKDG